LSLAQRTLKGIAWAYAAYGGRRIVNLITTAVLARLLVPDDFGLVAFASVVLSLLDALRNLGIHDALIYHTEHPEETASTAFWITLLLGIAKSGLAFAVAPLSVLFFNDPRLPDILRVMGLTFTLDALGATHATLLRKELAFRRRFYPDLISSAAKAVASITLALLGLGVWSLVIGQLVSTGLGALAVWWVLPWRPQARLVMERARSLWVFGVNILVLNLLGVALDHADDMVIGTLLGAAQLGYLAVAARFPELFIANFSLILTQVLFPAYAKMKDDREKLTAGYLATTRYTAMVTVGAGFGMAAIAPELVRVVFGSQWGPAVALLQVVAFLAMVSTLPWAAGDAFKAIGRPDVSTKLLVIESLYAFPVIWYMAYRWQTAVAASLGNLITATIAVLVRLVVTSRLLKFKPTAYLPLFRAPFLGGVMILALITAWRWLVASWPDILILATSIAWGGAIYIAILFLLERDELLQARDMLLSLIQRRASVDEREVDRVSP